MCICCLIIHIMGQHKTPLSMVYHFTNVHVSIWCAPLPSLANIIQLCLSFTKIRYMYMLYVINIIGWYITLCWLGIIYQCQIYVFEASQVKSHNYVGCWCIVASVLRLHGEMMKYSTFLIFTIFVTITKHFSHTSLASWTLCVDICYDSVYLSLPA